MLMFVISGGLVSNVELFDSLTFILHLGVNRSASLDSLTRSCIKSTFSTTRSRCRHFLRCCINYGQPMKTVVSCPCILGTLRCIAISVLSRPLSLYPHPSASALSCATRTGEIKKYVMHDMHKLAVDMTFTQMMAKNGIKNM